MSDALKSLTDAGTSIWLDDLSRTRLDSGNLAQLMGERSVRGVTTNPSIFEKAISGSADAYAADLRACATAGLGVDATIRRLTTDDVRRACDLLMGIYTASQGVDGRVSIEVDPRLAHDTEGTVAQAHALWKLVDRPNLLIKIPATVAGLPAITAVIGAGISVNVTLIFSVERYREVVLAYMAGLRRAADNGLHLGSIHSVASVFVSRVDGMVDPMLDAIGSELATELRGAAAIANARLVWAAYREISADGEWQQLLAAGANAQRPLWASTGVKDHRYDDTRYVIELAVPGSVNTVPEATLQAVFDHGSFGGDTVTPNLEAAQGLWAQLETLGIGRTAVCDKLEADGVRQFIEAWERLRSTVEVAIAAARAQ